MPLPRPVLWQLCLQAPEGKIERGLAAADSTACADPTQNAKEKGAGTSIGPLQHPNLPIKRKKDGEDDTKVRKHRLPRLHLTATHKRLS